MHWSTLFFTGSELIFKNDLVRCGSFFPFQDKILCKRSKLFAIYFSMTSIGLDTKHNMQNQIAFVWELNNILLREYDRNFAYEEILFFH